MAKHLKTYKNLQLALKIPIHRSKFLSIRHNLWLTFNIHYCDKILIYVI